MTTNDKGNVLPLHTELTEESLGHVTGGAGPTTGASAEPAPAPAPAPKCQYSCDCTLPWGDW